MLLQAARSVREQTLRELEILIIDDGSSDDTPQVCSALSAQDPRVTTHRQPNSGPVAAHAAGLARASAPWVAFLDDDDLWHPEALRALLSFATGRAPTVACLAASFETAASTTRAEEVLGDPGRFNVRPWPPNPPGPLVSCHELVMRTILPVNAALFGTELLRSSGGFDLSLAAAEDYDVWLRLSARAPIPVLQRTLALVRRHAGQTSGDLGRMVHAARIVLTNFLQAHPEVELALGHATVRQRLGNLACEEAYAALLTGDRRWALRAALAALTTNPRRAKAWAYLCFAPLPRLYQALRRSHWSHPTHDGVTVR